MKGFEELLLFLYSAKYRMIKLSVHLVILEQRGKCESVAKYDICLENDQFRY